MRGFTQLALPSRAGSGVAVGLLLLLTACQPVERRPSGRVYPLPRQQPGDGLAVVNRPQGEGLQIWLDPDTSRPGICTPRWNPDAARLQGGNGPRPRATGPGLAPGVLRRHGQCPGALAAVAPVRASLPAAGTATPLRLDRATATGAGVPAGAAADAGRAASAQ